MRRRRNAKILATLGPASSSQEQIRAPAHAASQDHGFWIEDRRDRGDAEGEATGLGLDHLERVVVPASGSCEHALGRGRRAHPELACQLDDAARGHGFLEGASSAARWRRTTNWNAPWPNLKALKPLWSSPPDMRAPSGRSRA